jgi:chorismate mutase
MPGDPGSDPLVSELRAQITATDLALVDRLKEHKAAQGYDFLDKGREDALLAELERANGGPLSADGLRELHAELLDLTKRELG